jgi:hypothetical protein
LVISSPPEQVDRLGRLLVAAEVDELRQLRAANGVVAGGRGRDDALDAVPVGALLEHPLERALEVPVHRLDGAEHLLVVERFDRELAVGGRVEHGGDVGGAERAHVRDRLLDLLFLE